MVEQQPASGNNSVTVIISLATAYRHLSTRFHQHVAAAIARFPDSAQRLYETPSKTFTPDVTLRHIVEELFMPPQQYAQIQESLPSVSSMVAYEIDWDESYAMVNECIDRVVSSISATIPELHAGHHPNVTVTYQPGGDLLVFFHDAGKAPIGVVPERPNPAAMISDDNMSPASSLVGAAE